MTLNIEKGQPFSKGNIQRLHLVYSACKLSTRTRDPKLSEPCSPATQRKINQLVDALMCRLWIPHASTIVGLLGVGLSRTNFDELSKWVTYELQLGTFDNTSCTLQILERRFRMLVDQYPEV